MKDKYKNLDELDALLSEWEVDLVEDPFMATRVQARIETGKETRISRSLLQIKCCLGVIVLLFLAMAAYLIVDYSHEKEMTSDAFLAFAERLDLRDDQWAQMLSMHKQFIADIAFLRSDSERIDESIRAMDQIRKKTNYVDFIHYYQLVEKQRVMSQKKGMLLKSLSDCLKEVLDPDQYRVFNRFLLEYTSPESYSS